VSISQTQLFFFFALFSTYQVAIECLNHASRSKCSYWGRTSTGHCCFLFHLLRNRKERINERKRTNHCCILQTTSNFHSNQSM
jgi:hypothetical protein